MPLIRIIILVERSHSDSDPAKFSPAFPVEIVEGVFLKGIGVTTLWPQMAALLVFGDGSGRERATVPKVAGLKAESRFGAFAHCVRNIAPQAGEFPQRRQVPSPGTA